MTNADRIREMSDEELAEFLNDVEEYGISSQYIDVPLYKLLSSLFSPILLLIEAIQDVFVCRFRLDSNKNHPFPHSILHRMRYMPKTQTTHHPSYF